MSIWRLVSQSSSLRSSMSLSLQGRSMYRPIYGRGTTVEGLFGRGTRALYSRELYSKGTIVEKLCRF